MFCALAQQLWGREGSAAKPRVASPRPCLPLPYSRAGVGWHSPGPLTAHPPPPLPWTDTRGLTLTFFSISSRTRLCCSAMARWHCGPAGNLFPFLCLEGDFFSSVTHPGDTGSTESTVVGTSHVCDMLSQALLWEQAGLLPEGLTTELKRAEHFPWARWWSKCFYKELIHPVFSTTGSVCNWFPNYYSSSQTIL